MAAFKGTVFFERGRNGWTENWWIDAAAAANAMTLLRSYVTQRRKLLSLNAYVTYLRVTNPDPPRDSQFHAMSPGEGIGTGAEWGDATDDEVTDAAVNVRFTTAGGKWRNLMLRGIPENAIVSEGTSRIRASYFEAIQEFLGQAVRNNGMRMRVMTAGTSVGITTVTQVASRVVAITTAAALAPAPSVGTQVRIRNMSGSTNVNGVYTVNIPPVGGNTYSFRPKILPVYGVPDPVIARAEVLTPDYQAITTVTPINVTTRQTGRPFGLRRGKRSVRRS